MSKRAYHNLAQVVFIIGFLYLPASIVFGNIFMGIGSFSLIVIGISMAYLGSRRPSR